MANLTSVYIDRLQKELDKQLYLRRDPLEVSVSGSVVRQLTLTDGQGEDFGSALEFYAGDFYCRIDGLQARDPVHLQITSSGGRIQVVTTQDALEHLAKMLHLAMKTIEKDTTPVIADPRPSQLAKKTPPKTSPPTSTD